MNYKAVVHGPVSSTILMCTVVKGVPYSSPGDLLLDCFCIGFSKQIQHSTAEIVGVAVWVSQLIGDGIQEQVST